MICLVIIYFYSRKSRNVYRYLNILLNKFFNEIVLIRFVQTQYTFNESIGTFFSNKIQKEFQTHISMSAIY